MTCANPSGPFVISDGVRGGNVGMSSVVETSSVQFGAVYGQAADFLELQSAAFQSANADAPDSPDDGGGASVGGYTTGMGSTIV